MITSYPAMIRSTLPATSISSWGTTVTSGFRALIVFRAEEAGLAGRTDLGDQQVAAIALLLLRRQDHRGVPAVPGRFPSLEATAHRGDIRVAELLERLRGE